MNLQKKQNSHEPLVERALMGQDLAAEHHLANCPCCRAERDAIEEALRHFAELQREQANRPEDFWERQAERIREDLHRPATTRRFARVWIPALATVVVGMMLLLLPRSQSPRVPQEVTLSDQEVLREVERAMEGGTPMALRPAGLYTEEDLENVSRSNANLTKEQLRHAD